MREAHMTKMDKPSAFSRRALLRGALVVSVGSALGADALLAEKKKPSEAEIKQALEGLKCRCGTHMGIMRAVKRAAAMMG